MSRKKYSAEQIVAKLREAEVLLAKSMSLAEVCRQLEITDVTYYRWRKEFGGLRVDQAKRLKEIELENTLQSTLALVLSTKAEYCLLHLTSFGLLISDFRKATTMENCQ